MEIKKPWFFPACIFKNRNNNIGRYYVFARNICHINCGCQLKSNKILWLHWQKWKRRLRKNQKIQRGSRQNNERNFLRNHSESKQSKRKRQYENWESKFAKLRVGVILKSWKIIYGSSLGKRWMFWRCMVWIWFEWDWLYLMALDQTIYSQIGRAWNRASRRKKNLGRSKIEKTRRT